MAGKVGRIQFEIDEFPMRPKHWTNKQLSAHARAQLLRRQQAGGSRRHDQDLGSRGCSK